MGKSIDDHIHTFFYHFGHRLHYFRWLAILLPLLTTAVLSYGFTYIDERNKNDTEYVFTPTNARAKTERQVMKDLWPLKIDHFVPGKSFEVRHWMELVITTKPTGGDVLSGEILKEVSKLNSYIKNNFTILTYDKRFQLEYRDICLNWEWRCYENEHVSLFQNRASLKAYVNLTYPRGGQGDTPVYFGSTVGGVTTNDQGVIEKATAIRLVYALQQNNSRPWSRMDMYSNQYIMSLQEYLLNVFHSDLIELGFAHPQSINQGLEENSSQFLPNFTTSVILLCVFATICSFTFLPPDSTKHFKWNRIPRVDWVRSKPGLAAAGIMSAGMAVVSSYGLLLLCGAEYNVISSVMPFLIVSIGVDDMFIMASAWYRTHPLDPVPERLGNTLAEAAVSVAITSLTDALSFAIGCITDLPGVRIFCSYAAMAVVFDYIYQVTFFAAIMSWLGETEKAGRHCLFWNTVTPPQYAGVLSSFFNTGLVIEPEERNTLHNDKELKREKHLDSVPTTNTKTGQHDNRTGQHDNRTGQRVSQVSTDTSKSKKSKIAVVEEVQVNEIKKRKSGWTKSLSKSSLFSASSQHDSGSRKARLKPVGYKPTVESAKADFVSKFFGEHYGPLLLHPVSKTLTLVLLICYLGFAVWGCLQIKEGLNPANLIVKEHYLGKYFDKIETFWEAGVQAHVALTTPPDLRDGVQRAKLFRMVEEFETTPHSMGRQATMFWLYEYMNYLKGIQASVENTTRVWVNDVIYWLDNTGGRNNWLTDMVWTPNPNNTSSLTAYRFQIGLKHFNTPNNHREATRALRVVADKYPEFGVTVYHEYFAFADQYMIILPTTLRNIGIAMGCMVLVAFVLIPSIPCCVLITAAIVSIDLGVFGYMSWWNVNLDAISMITIIMSIGFAVDLSAHISYAYVKAEGTAEMRAIEALVTLGWPVFQGAMSTILGIMILSTVKAYMILTFFKTVFLVIVFGLVHSLLFLPVALTLLLPHHHKHGNACCAPRDEEAEIDAAQQKVKKKQDTKDVQDLVQLNEHSGYCLCCPIGVGKNIPMQDIPSGKEKIQEVEKTEKGKKIFKRSDTQPEFFTLSGNNHFPPKGAYTDSNSPDSQTHSTSPDSVGKKTKTKKNGRRKVLKKPKKIGPVGNPPWVAIDNDYKLPRIPPLEEPAVISDTKYRGSKLDRQVRELEAAKLGDKSNLGSKKPENKKFENNSNPILVASNHGKRDETLPTDSSSGNYSTDSSPSTSTEPPSSPEFVRRHIAKKIWKKGNPNSPTDDHSFQNESRDDSPNFKSIPPRKTVAKPRKTSANAKTVKTKTNRFKVKKSKKRSRSSSVEDLEREVTAIVFA